MMKRIEELEVKVAFQENTIAELNEVVCRLADHVDQLERQIRELREQHAASQPAPISEKPPHY